MVNQPFKSKIIYMRPVLETNVTSDWPNYVSVIKNLLYFKQHNFGFPKPEWFNQSQIILFQIKKILNKTKDIFKNDCCIQTHVSLSSMLRKLRK